MINLRTFRWILWGAVGLALIGSIALWSFQPVQTQQTVAEGRFGGGEYQLVSGSGDPIDDSAFIGHPSAVFFGFTHCPDVCPTTLAEMAVWFERLGDEAGDLRAYFVTVDPERDTPEILGEYVNAISDNITAVSGDPEEIDKIVEAFSVHAERVPLEGGGYTMNHTASVFLLNESGGFESTIAYQEATDTALNKLRNLVES